jgi:cytochrome P450
MAMCELFAVPDHDRPRLLALTAVAMSTDVTPRTPAEVAAAKRELLQYYADLLPERRAAPGDDLISRLAAGAESARLSAGEIVLNCYNVVIGGDETSRFASAGAVLALIRNPDQWQRLVTGDVVLDNAVEEMMRWTTPATHVARAATQDLTLAGTRIRAGEIVTLWNSSANHDEAVFDRPHRLNLDRAPNRHLAFGHGPHFCIGATLARAELRHLLTELGEQIERIELAGSVGRIDSPVLAGVSRLPIRAVPRRRPGTRRRPVSSTKGRDSE